VLDLLLAGHVGHQVDDAVAVAELIVVPGETKQECGGQLCAGFISLCVVG
jgi:hypothetical protein